MKKFARLLFLCLMLEFLFSCDTDPKTIITASSLADSTKYVPSNNPIKVYERFNLNDPISKYDWKNWEKHSLFKPPYDFEKHYSSKSLKSELHKFNNVHFDLINIRTINDSIYKVELIASGYLKEKPSSYPLINLNKYEVDEVVEIFKEKFGQKFHSTKTNKDWENFIWDLPDYTVFVESRQSIIPFFIPNDKENYDKKVLEHQKGGKALIDQLTFSLENERIGDGHFIDQNITSLTIVFTSKYLEMVSERMHNKIHELDSIQQLLNKKKAIEKL